VQASTQVIGTIERAVALVTGTSQSGPGGFTRWVTLKYDSAEPPFGQLQNRRWEIYHPLGGTPLGHSVSSGIEAYLEDPNFINLWRVFVAGTSGATGNDDIMTIHYEEIQP
jgi:hypothetical protein